jgi:hypothetical protein
LPVFGVGVVFGVAGAVGVVVTGAGVVVTGFFGMIG